VPNVLPANLAFWSCLVITGHGVLLKCRARSATRRAQQHLGMPAQIENYVSEIIGVLEQRSRPPPTVRKPPSHRLVGGIWLCHGRSLCLLEKVFVLTAGTIPEMEAAVPRGVTRCRL
jgi:hypothetical protein